MAPATKTTPDVTALLERNELDAIAAGRVVDDVRGELAQVGQRGAPGNPSRGVPAIPASGRIGDALRQQIKAHAEAPSGERADVSELERVVADLETKRGQLELELRGARQRQQAIQFARPVILAEHHSALVEIARETAASGEAAWLLLNAAAQDVEQHRHRVQRAVELALGGHPGTRTGATNQASQAAKALRRSFAPYVGATPGDNATWAAVSRCTAPAAPPAPPVEPVELDAHGNPMSAELRRVKGGAS